MVSGTLWGMLIDQGSWRWTIPSNNTCLRCKPEPAIHR